MLPDDRTKITKYGGERYRPESTDEAKEIKRRPKTSEDDERKRSKFKEALTGTDQKRAKGEKQTVSDETEKTSPFGLFEQETVATRPLTKKEEEPLMPTDETAMVEETEETPVKAIPTDEKEKPITKEPIVRKEKEDKGAALLDVQKSGQVLQAKPAETVHISATAPTEKRPPASQVRETVLKIIEQMTEALAKVELFDRTRMEITLNHPPMFAGTTLVLTEFKSAQKEFNLSFYNLTNPQARQLIETQQNQELLRTQLVAKGYTLQTVTIEPKLDATTRVEDIEFTTRRDDQSQQDTEGEAGEEGPLA